MISIKQTKLIRPPPGTDSLEVRVGNTPYLYAVTAFASLGAFLFGYDQGVMGVIVADQRWIDLMQPKNSWVIGMVVSLYDVGCFFGAMSLGYLADPIGRERTLAVACLVFIVGAVLQATSYSIAQITIGRVILGYGVGACAGGVPLYVAELSPPAIRGRIVAIEQMILCLGELAAFWMNYGFNFLQTDDWWRIPLAIQILPAAILALGCWFWLPPSPRWLVSQDRQECAREVLTRLHGSEAADLEILEIQASIDFEHVVSEATWKDMFTKPVLRVTLLGMGVQFLQQITGTNSILYYTPSLFERGGIKDPRTANLATGGVGIVLFVFSWVPIFYFDRLGRKTWLQIGTVGMMGAMIGITVLQWHAGHHPDDSANYTIIIFPYLFYVFFNISWGVGSWTYAAEIFPGSMRAKGNALTTASLWAACYIVAQASPPIGDAIGWGLYIIYSGICVIAFFFVRYCLVETRGRSLEEMSRLFGIETRLAERSAINKMATEEHLEDVEIGRLSDQSTENPELEMICIDTEAN
ncbi:Sugar transporter [Penicillium longicatenatum]|uniref:Sugar transporter n=1 Tax=Penicillium longicatenatum TaxID=1561947 RepID=UPI00254907AC|nr:Sugar transporter [Penicillium longicatenatum]KAJ5636894.1 Sugar transporter [Penicillium longicatenatum]